MYCVLDHSFYASNCWSSLQIVTWVFSIISLYLIKFYQFLSSSVSHSLSFSFVLSVVTLSPQSLSHFSISFTLDQFWVTATIFTMKFRSGTACTSAPSKRTRQSWSLPSGEHYCKVQHISLNWQFVEKMLARPFLKSKSEKTHIESLDWSLSIG